MSTHNDIFTNDDRNKVSHSLKHLRKLKHLDMYPLYNVKQNKTKRYEHSSTEI